MLSADARDGESRGSVWDGGAARDGRGGWAARRAGYDGVESTRTERATGEASNGRQQLSLARRASQGVGASNTGRSGEAKHAAMCPDGWIPACNIYVA